MVSEQQVPKGYKKTEVGVIPEDWEVKPLGEIGSVRGGSGFPLKHQGCAEGKFPFFKVSDMNNPGNEVFMRVANHYISEKTRRLIGAVVFPKDSIVFAKIGAAIFLERKRILSQPSCIDNNMAALVLSNNTADYLFIYYHLANMKLGDLVSTTALPALSSTIIETRKIPLPPLPEQRAIAAALSDVDGLLAALDALIAKKRAVKTAAMQQLLTGKTRLPGFADKQGYKRTEVGEIPEDWDVKSLSKLGSFCKGKGIKRDDVIANGAIPCVRYGEIYTHYENCVTNPVSRVSEVVAAAAQPIDYGDLLFAGSGETADEIGKCVAYLGPTPAVAGGDIVVLSA